MNALALGRPDGRTAAGRAGHGLPGASVPAASIRSAIVDLEERR
jgi:hypothetical protein